MSRTVTVFLPVKQDDVSAVERALLDEPSSWLPQARQEAGGRWHATVRLGPLERRVACAVGPPREETASVWRDLAWDPVPHEHERLPVHETLPTFHGEVGLHRDRAVLVIDGSYDVPGGRLGEFADAVALSGAARSTMSQLLADIIAIATATPVRPTPAA